MANKKISELAVATTPTGAELIEIVQGGVNKQTTAQDIADLGGGGSVTDVTGTTNRITSTGGATPVIDIDAAYDAAITAQIAAASLGLWDDRGTFDASVAAYPSSGGSGTAGAILKGDIWTISVAGTLPTGQVVEIGDTVRALIDTPGNTQANWGILQNNIGYVPVNKVGDTMSGNLAMGTNKVTGLGAASANGEAVRYEQVIGVQDLFIPASAMWPRVTAGCSPLAQTEIATSLFNIQTLDFNQTTQQFAQFQIVPPRKWNNGTVTFVPYWTASAGTGTVQWGLSLGAYSNDDALTVALGTEQTSDDTLIATNDLHVGPASSAITVAGTPADSDLLAVQISRNTASDTLTGDAKLLGISIRFTCDAAVDQ